VLLPVVLGMLLALPLYPALAPLISFPAFALFMAVVMAISAFPVLARILVERRMLAHPLGAITLACAAIDDVTAWILIAVASALAAASSGSGALLTLVLLVAFGASMWLIVRPLLARAAGAYEEAGRLPGTWVVAIFAAVLISAWLTSQIGVALIFGAFVAGLVMPRHAGLTEDVTRRLEDFVVILLLPLFFVTTGLRTNVGLIDQPELVLLTLLVIAVAVVAKLVGALLTARVVGFSWREGTAVGILLNTRGLTELIVLNLALELGAISPILFTMLVLMALATTFMTGPLLRLLDPRGELAAPIEGQVERAGAEAVADAPSLPVPDRSVLLACRTDAGLDPLVALAEPLAGSEPARELVLVRLVEPPPGADARGGLQTEGRLLREATTRLTATRRALALRGVAARAVAFVSSRPGDDVVRLARREDVDLVVVEGRRSLLGSAIPRSGPLEALLRDAPCDAAVLITREPPILGAGRALLVPFGGAEHDWAALELGAWLAARSGATLRLLGAYGEEEQRERVWRMLADTGLLVQRYAGVETEPVVTPRGKEGVLAAAEGAALLVVGLPEGWRRKGLGVTRSALAGSGAAPLVLVRRGSRPGALAPRDDLSRFSWSTEGPVPPGIDA
jgi:K+:H+ antiporter